MFRPYLEGEFDAFSVPLSTIIQIGSLAALLFSAIALIAVIIDFYYWKGEVPIKHATTFRRACLIISGIVTASAALGAFVSQSVTLAYLILGGGVLLMTQRWTAIEQRRLEPQKPLGALPYYLIFIPVTLCALRSTLLETAKERSTDIVIQNSAVLIQDIEEYRLQRGEYPLSLQSTIEDYKPGISSVSRYHYERHGDAYNLYFEQYSHEFVTQEIVMYNALDQQEMTVHDQDLLRKVPDRIIRGYFDVQDLAQAHWKIFYFD